VFSAGGARSSGRTVLTRRSLQGLRSSTALTFRGKRRFKRRTPEWSKPPPTVAAASRRSGDELGELRKIAGSSITSFRVQFRR
jgi:hypothetical protein